MKKSIMFCVIVITCRIRIMGLPLGTLLRYNDLPMQTKTNPNNIARVQMPKPQSQPWLVVIHTMKVTPIIAPMVRLNNNQLKKLDNWAASLGFLSSYWSAPKAGKAAFTPPLPSAIMYKPVKRIAMWLVSAASHLSCPRNPPPLHGKGLSWWRCACTVRRAYPWICMRESID